MLNRWKTVLLGLVLAFVSVSVVVYFEVQRGDAYVAACTFVKENQVIRGRLGVVTTCSLRLFGWSISYNGPNGMADFGLDVVGDKQSGEVFLDMRTNLGEWEVVGAKLRLNDGTFVPID